MFDVEEYRTAVRALGMTDAVADWWLGLNRPGVIFGPRIDGPSGGQFGGAPRLPADLEWPMAMTFVADIDCAALPREGVAEGFPRDGHLLFFSDLDFDHPETRVIHVPTGTPVVERPLPQAEDYHYWDLKHAPLHLATGLTFQGVEHGYPMQVDRADVQNERTSSALAAADPPCPDHCIFEIDGPPYFINEAAVKSLAELTEIPGDDASIFQVCGQPYVIQFNPEEVERQKDVILLAQLFLWQVEIPGICGDIVYWTISRDDLLAGRFDRVQVYLSLGG